MKTDPTVHTVSAPTATMPAFDTTPFPEKKLERNGNSQASSSALNIDPPAARSVSNSSPGEVQWNSLKPISRDEMPAAELPDSVKTGIKILTKLLNDMQPSLASLVLAFMTMSLQIFANLQKANMDSALNELNLMKMDMITQVKEMKDEKDATFKKEIIMGAIEMISAAVQLAGSAHTTVKLKEKIIQQETLFAQKDSAALKTSNEGSMASTSNKLEAAKNISADNNLTQNIKNKAQSITAGVDDDLTNAKAAQADANAVMKPARTPEEIKIKSDEINSKVALINARQQVFTGATALIKAMSPFVQGSLGAEATTHQISAKEAENSKEISSSLFRQYTDVSAAYRELIGRTLATFEDVQKQDAENSNAAARKMV